MCLQPLCHHLDSLWVPSGNPLPTMRCTCLTILAWKDKQWQIKPEAEWPLYLEKLASLWEQEEAWQALLEQKRHTVWEMLQEQRRQHKWEVLLMLTTTDSAPVWDTTLNTLSNIKTMISWGQDEMLWHFGQVLTLEELNWLQHTLNGNIKGADLHKWWGHIARNHIWDWNI